MKATQSSIITAVILMASVLVFSAPSQEPGDVATVEPKPYLLDEFGRLGDCDLRARFDTFLVELQQNPSMSGYVIFYNGRDVLPAFFESPVHERLLLNHIGFRQFDGSRVIVVRGGFRNSMHTQLWMLPADAQPPSPEDSDPMPMLPEDRAFKFDQKLITNEGGFNEPFLLDAVRERERRELAEQLGDDADEFFEDLDEVDAGEEDPFYWFSKEFGGYLSLRPGIQGVIIFYADDQRYDIAQLTNHIDSAVSEFEQDGERIAGRVDIVYGGYRSWPEAEFFILPAGAAFPESTPEERELETPELDY